MSLHFLGIKGSPVLHRQLSSPTIKLPEEDTSTHDLSQDSKDILVQRLLDLANSLTAQETLKDEDINVLHVNVDHMERVMRSSPVVPQQETFGGSRSVSSVGSSRSHDDDTFWGPFFPNRHAKPGPPSSPLKTQYSRFQDRIKISPERASDLATEAEALLAQLSQAMGELKARKEESDHIHELLVTRAENAAQRVIQLEERIEEIESDYQANESELSFLRLQMRALEVQGLQYMPANADPELTQSINNWKLDWADVDRRSKARRKRCVDSHDEPDDTQTVTDAS